MMTLIFTNLLVALSLLPCGAHHRVIPATVPWSQLPQHGWHCFGVAPQWENDVADRPTSPTSTAQQLRYAHGEWVCFRLPRAAT